MRKAMRSDHKLHRHPSVLPAGHPIIESTMRALGIALGFTKIGALNFNSKRKNALQRPLRTLKGC